MGRLLFNDRSDSPAMVLSPQQQHFRPLTNHSWPDPGPFSSFNPTLPATFIPSEQPPSFSRLSDSRLPGLSSSATLSAKASRKRSRDEFTSSTAGFETDNSTPVPAPEPKQPEEQPVYGEGMVLLNPRTGLAVSADSQTGTWYEEKAEVDAAAKPPVAVPTDPTTQPDHRSRKTQRLDATASNFDDITAASIKSKLQSSFRGNISGSPSTPSNMEEPQVDDLTQLLGISWQRISSDDRDMAAAIRGWEKYIDNHYACHLQGSRILLKHRGLNAYLVTSRTSSYFWENDPTVPINRPDENAVGVPSAFYLFNEDLSEARLVANDWETCAQRLRAAPIAFSEGSETIKPATKPFEDVQESYEGKDTEAIVPRMCARESGVEWEGLGPEVTMDIDS